MSHLQQIEQLRNQALAELDSLNGADAVEAWRIKYLGSKGLVKQAMALLKDIPPAEKPMYGKTANQIKGELTKAFQACKDAKVSSQQQPVTQSVDVTLPGTSAKIGHRHLLTQTVDEICDIFARMGFSIAYGPEVEDERHNFDALNIPPAHPARDPLDNFYIDEKIMLRSQTSTVQIRTMEATEPPVRIISPGRVYRPDTVDATHSFMFHQVEGLYVDEGVTMADLKTCVDQFCKAYFGDDIKTRFRPSFFPFTEPSAEIDVEFSQDDGSTKWIELGGCGMVDPNVLESVGYDSEKYTGYAFGLGIDRGVMRKHGIPDIRLLFESDVRFLRQF